MKGLAQLFLVAEFVKGHRGCCTSVLCLSNEYKESSYHYIASFGITCQTLAEMACRLCRSIYGMNAFVAGDALSKFVVIRNVTSNSASTKATAFLPESSLSCKVLKVPVVSILYTPCSPPHPSPFHRSPNVCSPLFCPSLSHLSLSIKHSVSSFPLQQHTCVNVDSVLFCRSRQNLGID